MYLKKFVLSYQSQGVGDGVFALALARLVCFGGEVIKLGEAVSRSVCDVAAHFLANAGLAAGGDRLVDPSVEHHVVTVYCGR